MASGHSRAGLGMRANQRIRQTVVAVPRHQDHTAFSLRAGSRRQCRSRVYRPNQMDRVPGLGMRQGRRLYKAGNRACGPVSVTELAWQSWPDRAGRGACPVCLGWRSTWQAKQKPSCLDGVSRPSSNPPWLANYVVIGLGMEAAWIWRMDTWRDADTGLREDRGWTLGRDYMALLNIICMDSVWYQITKHRKFSLLRWPSFILFILP